MLPFRKRAQDAALEEFEVKLNEKSVEAFFAQLPFCGESNCVVMDDEELFAGGAGEEIVNCEVANPLFRFPVAFPSKHAIVRLFCPAGNEVKSMFENWEGVLF